MCVGEVGVMENSLSQIIAEATILLSYISELFISMYRVQLKNTREFVDKGVQLLFPLGSTSPFSIPPGSQSLAIRMAPSFVACRVLFARGIIIDLYTVLITMAIAEGMEEICGHQPLWLTPLSAPSPVHSVCMDETVFVL